MPRILWKQGANLVNKFALLLHKYWLREDSWDKPKNDWYCGRLFSAFCLFLKYPSPDAKASPSPSRGEGMHRPWCQKILGTRPRMTGGRGANSFGRSMIEMLGVLAIIGVLSVGGIAGYSKAMEKYKVNKLVEEYTSLMFGLMEHMDNFSPLRVEGEYQERYYLADTIQGLNLLPAGWRIAGKQGAIDSAGNYVYTFVRYKHLTFDLRLGAAEYDNGYQIIQSFSSNLCFELFNNLLKPLHSSLYYAGLWKNKSAGDGYFGDKYCGDAENKCLSEATLSEIQNICSSCSVKQENCLITWQMDNI